MVLPIQSGIMLWTKYCQTQASSQPREHAARSIQIQLHTAQRLNNARMAVLCCTHRAGPMTADIAAWKPTLPTVIGAPHLIAKGTQNLHTKHMNST